MLCIPPYSCFFVQNVDLTISPIKKELDLHVGSDGDLKEALQGCCCFCCFCCYCSHEKAACTFLTFHQLFNLHFESNKNAVLKQWICKTQFLASSFMYEFFCWLHWTGNTNTLANSFAARLLVNISKKLTLNPYWKIQLELLTRKSNSKS